MRANASEILTRKDVEAMLEQAQKIVPRIVEELSGLSIHLGTVYRVLQLLLAQRISVRDLPLILEALAAEGGYQGSQRNRRANSPAYRSDYL